MMAQSGVAVAMVVDNKDESGTGRVKVRYPWHSQPRETYWARVATPMTGRGRGVYFIPEEGDEVLVAFERGDLRSPYVIGSLWNGTDRTPLTNADGRNDVRLIRTRKGHTLTFDDGATGRVQLELNDGKRLSIDDEQIALHDGNGNGLTIQSGSGAVTIRSAGRLVLQASQISIESSGTVEIKASATLTVRGALVNIN
jgi:uncharacterized protein involved in type VI secretion and phage assembly